MKNLFLRHNLSLKSTFKKSFCTSNNPNLVPKKKWDIKQYGKVGMVIYLSTFAVTFPTFYYLISRNYIDKNKLIEYIDSKGYDTKKYITKFGENNINFALAYLCLFCTKPLRIIFSCVLAGYMTKPKSDTNVKISNEAAGKKSSLFSKSTLKKLGTKGIALYSFLYLFGIFSFYQLTIHKYIKTEKIDELVKDTKLEYYNIKAKEKLGENKVSLATAIFLNELFEIFRLPFVIWVFSG